MTVELIAVITVIKTFYFFKALALLIPKASPNRLIGFKST
jgi:hypothetical protein